jgi:hypothetical protein
MSLQAGRTTIRRAGPLLLNCGLAIAVPVLGYLNYQIATRTIDFSPIMPRALPASEPANAIADAGYELAPPAARDLPETSSRPLFVPSRRAPVHSLPHATSTAPALGVELEAPAGDVLVGIMETHGIRKALIRQGSDSAGSWFAAGDSLGQWVLQDITADSAILQRSGATIELKLRYGNGEQGGEAAAGPSPKAEVPSLRE